MILTVQPTNGKIRQELLQFPRLDPYLIIKCQEEEYITSVSQNKYLYQKWEDIFQLNIQSEHDVLKVECWDYNVDEIEKDNLIAKADIDLAKIDFKQHSKNNHWVKLKDYQGQEIGEILFELEMQCSSKKQTEKRIKQDTTQDINKNQEKSKQQNQKNIQADQKDKMNQKQEIVESDSSSINNIPQQNQFLTKKTDSENSLQNHLQHNTLRNFFPQTNNLFNQNPSLQNQTPLKISLNQNQTLQNGFNQQNLNIINNNSALMGQNVPNKQNQILTQNQSSIAVQNSVQKNYNQNNQQTPISDNNSVNNHYQGSNLKNINNQQTYVNQFDSKINPDQNLRNIKSQSLLKNQQQPQSQMNTTNQFQQNRNQTNYPNSQNQIQQPQNIQNNNYISNQMVQTQIPGQSFSQQQQNRIQPQQVGSQNSQFNQLQNNQMKLGNQSNKFNGKQENQILPQGNKFLNQQNVNIQRYK